ncbi:reverse transcriptase domain-containing protein [Streptomyces sp. NPDC050255]|uniref:reverse transcriptase domain-containing protein n=1 Tax=Streptomyces sp. NPDC050255 TaxID=3365606 RepID=UPI0037B008B0
MGIKIDTFSVAKELDAVKLDRLPNLIVDKCLKDCSKEIAATAEMILTGEATFPHETLAMPKKKFEPRPVSVSTTAARVAYTALVKSIESDLGPTSRRDGNWDKYKSFATKDDSGYVVEFDIASFYEYIDHKTLSQQVLNHTLNSDAVQKLNRVLKSLIGGSKGIPQLLSASDHLSDVYIGTLERRLVRDGYSVARYADDFTAVCPDWETSNTVIERAAEYARDLGLVLSSEKTNIKKRATLLSSTEAEARFINDYFEAARSELMARVFLWGDYDLTGEDPSLVDDREAMKASMWSLVHDWHKIATGTEPEDYVHSEGHYRIFIRMALGWLQGNSERLPEEIIQEIVFKHPIFLDAVCKYVTSRSDTESFWEDPWATLKNLTAMGRQSPWAKLWLLDTVSSTHSRKMNSWSYVPVMEWVDRQLKDRHEVVRAQAAWAASCHGRLSEGSLTGLYTQASPLSQHALAACMANQGGVGKGIIQAIKHDTPMNRRAFEWAEKEKSSTN